jgi:hypothetical protein
LFVINWRNDTDIEIEHNGNFYGIIRIDVFEGYIAVSFEKCLIFITFSPPTAGRKYTDKFTFEDFFKA